jgi:hypothetical protein
VVALDCYPWVEEALTAGDAPVYQLRALSRLVRMPGLANNRVRLIDAEATCAALAGARQVILSKLFIIRGGAGPPAGVAAAVRGCVALG